MTNFDLLYLSFPGSLEYIGCQHYKSLFVLPIYYIRIHIYIYIFDILLWEQDWFCLSCIHRDLFVPLRVLSGSKRNNLVFVSVIFVYLFFTVAACESLIFPVNSVNEVARHPYLTKDCLILIFQSETASGGFLARQARQTSLAGGTYFGLSSTSSGKGYCSYCICAYLTDAPILEQ